MKNKVIISLSILLLVLVNISYYWERALHGWWGDYFTIGILFLLFICLATYLLFQIVRYLRKGSINMSLQSFATLVIILVIIAVFPRGIVKFEKYESPNLIKAYSTAPCSTTLEIKDNNRFHELSNCFGIINENRGDYTIKGDTIKLLFKKKRRNVSKETYCIIKLDTINKTDGYGDIIYFTDNKFNNYFKMKIIEYNY